MPKRRKNYFGSVTNKKVKNNFGSATNKQVKNNIEQLFKAIFLPTYRILKTLFSRDTIKEYRHKRNVAIDIFGVLVLLSILLLVGYMKVDGFIVFAYIAYGIIGLIMVGITVKILRNRKYRKTFSHTGDSAFDIDNHLRKALETMDSTAKWYNNEEEANRELVTCLKAQGISEVRYQYKLGNGRTADAKIGDFLIEGKLSPDTAEVDRLIGQLSAYTQYAHKLNVVVYGQFDREAKRRIENEIQSRYVNRVFLTYLNNPKRLRSMSSF